MFEFFKDRTNQLIIALLVVFSVISLWVRLLPMFGMGNVDILSMVASDDPLYNFRQVEQILANYPNYAWYDPMSLFPTGSLIYWGSFFPTLIATICIMVGANTRPEIIAVGLVIPPIMGMLMVTVMYFVGRIAGDWKTGLITAGFTAIVSGQFFYRSFYGYMDHHIAEVLFSSVFCLLYMYILYSEKDSDIKLENFSTYRKLVIVSVIAGIAYIVGMLVMPTMILFAMIVGFFTGLQFIIDVFRKRSTDYLLLTNTIIFSVVIIGLLLFGFKTQGLNLSSYSIGHVYAYLCLIGFTGFLYLLANRFKETPIYYPLALGGIGLAGIFGSMMVAPSVYKLLVKSFFDFFGQMAVTNTVQEAMGWTFSGAWGAFNYGLILMILGIIILLIKNVKDEHPYQIFVVVWSMVILMSTWQHVRYEYYLAVNVVLLSAVCISFIIEKGLPDIKLFANKLTMDIDKEEVPVKKSNKKRVQYKNQKLYKVVTPNYLILIGVAAIVGLGGLFVITSGSINYAIASSGGLRMNEDWKTSLEWMENNTPDTGVSYTQIYDIKTFKYPDTAYGVMSWWDYGHMITYIAKRIPNANPFQQGVIEETGASSFFVETSEDKANVVLDNAKTKYIITDIEMDTGKFYAMSTWYNSTLTSTPYQKYVIVDNGMNGYSTALLNLQDYYLTMVSRLHNFDGSYTEPSDVYYVEYMDPEVSKMGGPLVTKATLTNYADAKTSVENYNTKAQFGYHAIAASPVIVLPVEPVPALKHYRLIHESATNIFANSGTNVDIKYVKTFEYVKGAKIKGDGMIEVSVVSNTGREFVYRQQSTNGEFVVPYSTIGSSYDVKTKGKYKVVNTGKEYSVSENDIMNGSVVS